LSDPLPGRSFLFSRNVASMNEEKAKKETLWFVGDQRQWDNKKYDYKTVKSDKVYVVELYPDGPPDARGRQRWSVKASWGRRGKAFQSQVKCVQDPYYQAEYEFNQLVRAKTDKGYKKWEFVIEVEEMHMATDYDA
jgi:predicted DNA-binding WGR domain protein